VIKIPVVSKLVKIGGSKAAIINPALLDIAEINEDIEIGMKGKTITIKAHDNGK
jgi:hypothetical protein